MEITESCVVTLTWVMKDSIGRLLDELDHPVEFLVGGDDLLPVIEQKLQGKAPGAVLELSLEPEHAFGNYDENLVFLLDRGALPEGLEEGMLIETSALPEGAAPGIDGEHLLTVTEIYPEHVVLDGNHPLAGIALRLRLKVVDVREASVDEVGRGSAGTGFFRLKAEHPAPDSLQ